MQPQKKRRVALIGPQILLGEGLQNILQKMEDVDLFGPWELGPEVDLRVSAARPDVVLIADVELDCEAVKTLRAQLFDQFPNLPVIQVDLSQAVFRVYTMQTSPARSADLIEAIRRLPQAGWPSTDERSSDSGLAQKNARKRKGWR